MSHVDPAKREDWDYQMNTPLPGREVAQVNEVSAEIEGEGFMSAMMQHKQVTGKGA